MNPLTLFIFVFFFAFCLVLLAVGLHLCLEVTGSRPARREAGEEWSPATTRATSAGTTIGSTESWGESQLPSYSEATKPPNYLEANNLPQQKNI